MNGCHEHEYEIVEPSPSSFAESLRSIGYTLSTAIADIIDNSISAGAKNVWLHFHWEGPNSWISAKDDGTGIPEDQFANAMRLGGTDPLAQRGESDLGRFGLGLKTASFSQCRKVTVWSKVAGLVPSSRCWDLDYLSHSGQWRLRRTLDEQSRTRLGDTQSLDHGTVVLWEKMDRLVAGTQAENRKEQDAFYRQVEQVEHHIGMVFHKYIERPGRLALWINNRKVPAWNPFMPINTATQGLPEEIIHTKQGAIIVKPYILPHKSRLSAEEFLAGSGSRGWNDMQGFYVYRNQRLLVAADWLGLGFTKEEHCKLARIELSITGDMDMEWQIDIKKSRARAPEDVRDSLKRIARLTRVRAVDVYRARGKVVSRSAQHDLVFLWSIQRRHGRDRYVINRDHPAVMAVIRGLSDQPEARRVDTLLRLIEETLPAADVERNVLVGGTDRTQLRLIAREVLEGLRLLGSTRDECLDILSRTQPFASYPDIVAELGDMGDEWNDTR